MRLQGSQLWIAAAALLSVSLGAVAPARQAQAEELYDLYRGARRMGMGGAYIALADDEQAVWANPAGLAGNRSSGIHVAIADLTISTDVLAVYLEAMSGLGGVNGAILNTLMGRNIHTRVQVTPTLMLGNLGISIIGDQQFALYAENVSLPQIQFGYQTTNGIQLAYGHELFKRKKKRLRVRVGGAAKMLFRRGGYQMLPPSALLNVSQEALMARVGNFGMGYGVDFGTQFLLPLPNRFTLSAAFVATDIGDTSFGDGPQPIRMNVATGFALQYALKNDLGRVSLLWDLRHLNSAADWRRKNHVGAELKLPLFAVFGGYNQMYLTYGASFDIYLFRLTAVSYGEELGAMPFQDPQRRWMLRTDLRFAL